MMRTSYKGGRTLKEICAKTNPLGLRVFVNGEPKLSEMEATEFSLMASTLELAISQDFDNDVRKREKRDEKINREEIDNITELFKDSSPSASKQNQRATHKELFEEWY